MIRAEEPGTSAEAVREPASVADVVTPTEEIFVWRAGALTVSFGTGEHPVRIVGVNAGPQQVVTEASQPLVEAIVAGDGRARNTTRFTHTGVGARLRLVDVRESTIDGVARLEIDQRDARTGLLVTVTFTASPDIAGARVRTSVRNEGPTPVVLEALSTVAIGALVSHGDDPHDALLHSGSGEQLAENRWVVTKAWSQAGLGDFHSGINHQPGRGYTAATGTSTWTTARALPTGVLEHPRSGRAIAWQLEHNGGWRWEIDNQREGEDALALVLLGPTDLHHHWAEELLPGASFESVPASFTVGSAGAASAVAELTRHRRWLRRAQRAHSSSLLVFNDFMNTILGDPTTERLLPLIAAAAAVGAECFCIDAGWYDDSEEGDWWSSVGEWLPSTRRFPGGGLARVTEAIRSHGMKVGIWVEPEVIGVRSPLADTLPDDAFMQRHGIRVREHDRYFLDLRNEAAREHLDRTFDRLIADFGVRYFKLDYNVTPGAGTDLDAFSAGAGLLAHNRAHLSWFAALRARHPDVVFENCSSGAMRSDFGMMEVFDLQATSDQQDFRLYPPIAAAAPMQMLPEQAASWAYPQPWMSQEEIAFTMVTGLSGRLYLSGFLNRMNEEQFALVEEAVQVFTTLRSDIAGAVPEWPSGYPDWKAPALSLRLRAAGRSILYVWHRSETTAESLELDLGADATPASLRQIYPASATAWTISGNGNGRIALTPPTPGVSARIYGFTAG
ncbi:MULTISPECIES: glycoside hydrolase family 36 protein [unclassified Rathayibacter]|uniref:glycoside hydrolase family 36 protein n=1 Tax=unclassified Rathayibacter TaxID=2609250 RepID=UPI000CE92066|nr:MULTISPECIES: glycoside hydrolase family 36 protein [unclassified Rathayibacter]PPG09878.1 alpha-galactosidase [Rathayibacter sp. AY2B1]PPG69064.1 alpha-galactosidase [Rathayibacter sp. AY1F4]